MRPHRNIEAVQADANPEKSAAMSQSASSLTRSWAKFYWEQSNSRIHPGRQRDLTIAYVEPTDRGYLSIAPTRTHSHPLAAQNTIARHTMDREIRRMRAAKASRSCSRLTHTTDCTMLKTRVIAARDLTPDHANSWREIQDEHPLLSSPHFSPEIARIFGSVRPDSAVCIVEQDGQHVGFLPFHRDSQSRASCIGRHLSDFQGAVYRPTFDWNTKEILRRVKIKRLNFTDWVVPEREFQAAALVTHQAPHIDLSQGFEAYRIERRQHTRELQEGLRKTRKISRDTGPLRLEPYCEDKKVLSQMLKWKASQLKSNSQWNALRIPWTDSAFHAAMDIRTPAFAGMLTALWAGDQLVAATMGIRSRSVLHGWVIAYAPEFRKYSPGLMLILKLAQQCESLGIERIDMGRGDEFFKTSFASGFTEVHDGLIDADPLNVWLHNVKVHVRESLRNTWLGRPLKTIVERARFATSRTA